MVLLVLQPYMVLADLKTGGSQVWLLCGGQVFKPGSRVVVRFWWVVRFSKLNTVLQYGLLSPVYPGTAWQSQKCPG